MYACTNGLKNAEGGRHVKAIIDAVSKSLKPYAGKKADYKPTDLIDGAVGIINAKLAAPAYSNQRKDQLIDARVYDLVYPEALKELTEFWKKNKSLAKKIIQRAIDLRKKTDDFLKDKKLLKNVTNQKKKLSAKLADVNPKTPRDKTELFLVEGDSAGGCFVGDTKIQLINGVQKRIDEIAEDNKKGVVHYGYAHSNKSGVHVVPIDSARLIKYTKYLTKVTLDNGITVICTRDHKWKLRDGTYCEAEKLEHGDSLMPHYEKVISKKGHRRKVWSPYRADSDCLPIGTGNYRGAWKFVYRMIGNDLPKFKKRKQKFEDKGIKINIHHKDKDTMNDDPSNLQVMSEKAHRILHAVENGELSLFKKGDENIHSVLMRTDKKYRKRKVKEAKIHFSNYWSNESNRKAQSERVAKHMEDPNNRNKISESVKNWWTEERRAEQAKRAKIQSNDPKRKENRKRTLLKGRKEKFIEILANCTKVNESSFQKAQKAWVINEGLKRKPFKTLDSGINLFKRGIDEVEEKIKKYKESLKNHRVIKVKNIVLSEKVPVYDLSVDKYHNYALAAGVYVHNTSKRARDKSFQAVFPLKGKPLNVMEVAKDKVNTNEELTSILAAIGVDTKSQTSRYGKILIMADGDIDGMHISVLLLTFLYKYTPFLIKEGRVGIVQTPEFLTRFKGKTYFADTKEELYEATKSKNIDITQLKGLGEISDTDLKHCAMDPKTRKVFMIEWPDSSKKLKDFEALMGKNSDYRKKLLNVD